MALSVGTRLGSYQVVALIGVGGMGEVYRARDTRLKRDVAIKTLPPELTTNQDRLARFEREARVLASLSHPNIAVVHGIEETAGAYALVMELVEGETLAHLSARRGPLPLVEALDIARQIALALEAAHEKGVVHRDIKPPNIQVASNGVVKVLDFGIAKALRRDDASAGTAVTELVEGTEIGVPIGTPEYMSPEQTRGSAVDAGADVWAFACVLYELLTGKRAFAGATRSDTIAAVLERDPDWTQLPAEVPSTVRRLLRRCLAKDPHRRLRDIGAVRILLEDALEGSERAPAPARAAPARRAVAYGALAAVSGAFGIGAALYVGAPAAPSASLRLSIATPQPIVPQLSATISPDGREVAFVATDADGQTKLWLRALDSLEARALPGTEGALHPFWSPDGRALGFMADSKLKRTSAVGGTVQTLADGVARGGATWSANDVILFTRGFSSGLWTIPATGGTPKEVTTLASERGEATHGWPSFLPEGRRFLYFAQNADPRHRGIYVGSLDGGEPKLLLASDHRGFYAPPGHLLFVRGETLMAQRFDVERLELAGDAALVAAGVWANSTAGQASFSVARDGTIAYVNASLYNQQLSWFDRQGRLLAAVGGPERYTGQVPQLAPDEQRLAIARGPWAHEQLWLVDTRDGSGTRLSYDQNQATRPVWSDDGQRILYGSRASELGAEFTVWIKRLGTTEPDERIYTGPGREVLDWSSDGRFAVYTVLTPPTRSDIWLLPLDPKGAPEPLFASSAHEYQAQISPDDEWIAYVSDESGTEEVYAERFPRGGAKRQISYGGGNEVRWRGDGRELYFVAPDGRVMAVEVRDPAVLDVGPATPLFSHPLGFFTSAGAGVGPAYDVAKDGQRFLIVAPPADLGPPITVVTNWAAATP